MNPRLAWRFLVPMVAVSLLLLAIGVVAAWSMHRLQSEVSEILAAHVGSVRAAGEFEISMRETRKHLSYCLLTGDRAHLRHIPELRAQTDYWLTEAERLATTPKEASLTRRIRQGYEQFCEQLAEISESRSTPVSPRKVLDEIHDGLMKEILKPAHDYLELNEETAVAASKENQRMTQRMSLVLLLLGSTGSLAGLLAGFAIARGIRQSLVQLSLPLGDAAGKLKEVVGPITFSTRGGFKDLERILRTVAEHVGTVVRRLQESQREILRSEQLAAVGQMAAGMAHELRNPLMAMKLLVQAAAERGLRDRDLTVLEDEILRLENLVQSFLNYARPPQIEKRPVNLVDLIRQKLVLVASTAEPRGIHIDVEWPTVPVIVEADLGQMRQVLLNLLLNAVDAIEPPGGRVIIRIRDDRHSGTAPSGVAIEVEDTGRGLPLDLGARIFEPFVSSRETGLGLGLSICKRIMEAHGGKISACSLPQGGARFTVWLPAAVASDSSHSEEPSREVTDVEVAGRR
ncbi:MAG: histidine kinase [Planctomycetes bacterium]|nr:histidine kinase [Planctomycetota bacterium]